MPFELLSAHDLDLIHQTSMRLLAQVGVAFPQREALAILAGHGAQVDGARVRLTERQVLDALELVPKQFTIHARNPGRNVTVGGGRAVFAPGYGAPFLVDAEAGKRAPTLDDYHALAKLSHALPNQDLSGYLLVDPAGGAATHLHMLHAHLTHSDKPFMGSTAGAEGAQQTLALARIVFGADLGDRPVTISLINSLSPLGYSTEMLDVLLVYAQARQPLILAALAMAGSTAPVTLAGMLAMQNAELLAGIVLTQWLSPGLPGVFGSTSTNIDMRTGALCIGSPELSQLIAAHAQLARHYGLPSRSGGSLTDASYPDAQAGYESMLGLLTAVNSGVDFVLHSAGILSSYLAFSYEKFVLDDEMCGMVRHLQRGFAVDADSLAYDVIADVGPGGNYLMQEQTLARCRTEFWSPAVVDRAGLEAWMTRGRRSAVDRARERWQKLVRRHEDPKLDETLARQLADYVETHQ